MQTDTAQSSSVCKDIYSYPRYSPNGLWLEKLCYSELDHSLIMTLSNSESQVLWKLLYRDYIPHIDFVPADGKVAVVHWSNDGRYAYFSSYSKGSGGGCFAPYSHGGWGLFRLDLQTGNITTILPLVDTRIVWYGFSFSTTDRQLVYGVYAENFVILDMTTEESLNINHEKDFDDGGGFVWSQDGLKFVYSTGTFTSESEIYSLRLVDVQTGSEQILLESDNSCYLATEWKDNNTVLIEQIGLYGQETILAYDLKTNIASTLVP
jgi:dipeptidyl aminopeptidase/acylaminoacyl peptidase